MRQSTKTSINRTQTPRKIFYNTLTIFALVAPSILFFFLWLLYSRINSILLFIAGFGTLILGIAFCLTIIAFNPSVPGVKWSWWYIAIYGVGILWSTIPSLFLFIPQLANQQDEKQIAFYILCAGLFFIMYLYHCILRILISAYYQNLGMRKRDIKKYTTGYRNYWFYTKINQQKSLGLIRYFIIATVLLYGISLCVYLLFGWLKFILIIVGFLLFIICFLNGLLLVWGKIISYNPKSDNKYISFIGCIVLAIFAIWILGIGTLEKVLVLLK